MLASADSERLTVFEMIEAEIRTNRPEDDFFVEETIYSYLNEKVPGIPARDI